LNGRGDEIKKYTDVCAVKKLQYANPVIKYTKIVASQWVNLRNIAQKVQVLPLHDVEKN
jgi:hypothetical protein